MSMSTKIDDLPIEVNEIPAVQSQSIARPDLEHVEPETNITMNVRKKNTISSPEQTMTSNTTDFFSYIKSEVTEENLLILVLLYVSSMTLINKYLKKIPFLANLNNELLINILKIVGIFVIYILIKRFVLPKIKL